MHHKNGEVTTNPILSDKVILTATHDISAGKEIVARRIAEQAIMEALYLALIKIKGNLNITTICGKTTSALEFNKIP